MIEFNLPLPLVLQLIISTILPLLVGLVTTRVTSGGIKAIVLAALSLVTSLVTEIANAVNAGTTYDIGQGLLLAIPTFIIAVSMHYGLWKPTGTSQAAQEVLVTSKGDDETYRA